jgi:group I intron endonuclease
MRSYVLYIHTNTINNKRYVGITSQNPLKRWKKGEGYKNNTHFYKAIQKYGWNNFIHEIVYEGLTQLEAENLEKDIIKKYDSNNPLKGYNIEKGGSCGDKYTEETKQKISKALKGKPKSESHKLALSKSRKGYKPTEESKKKQSIRMSGKNNPMYGKKRDLSKYKTKPVRCIETGKVYVSGGQASRMTGVCQGDISKNCNNKLSMAGGYHWEFVKEG